MIPWAPPELALLRPPGRFCGSGPDRRRRWRASGRPRRCTPRPKYGGAFVFVEKHAFALWLLNERYLLRKACDQPPATHDRGRVVVHDDLGSGRRRWFGQLRLWMWNAGVDGGGGLTSHWARQTLPSVTITPVLGPRGTPFRNTASSRPHHRPTGVDHMRCRRPRPGAPAKVMCGPADVLAEMKSTAAGQGSG